MCVWCVYKLIFVYVYIHLYVCVYVLMFSVFIKSTHTCSRGIDIFIMSQFVPTHPKMAPDGKDIGKRWESTWERHSTFF